MIRGSCHCGTITFEITEDPPHMVACNCSICRRLATLWVHSPPSTTTVLNVPEGATEIYAWGDKDLLFHTCKKCGCTTHWSGAKNDRFAVNCRLAEPEDIKDIPIKHFDGAVSWEFLD